MRLILTGTEKKLSKPSRKDLALPNWDNAYLEWVDLSGKTIPPMRDADVFHYKATGTVFGDTDWTQFRFPIDLTNAVIPLGVSSYNADFVIEVLNRRRQELTGLPRQVAQADYDYLLGDYTHSWQDTYHHAMKTLGISLEEAYTASLFVFEGYPHLLSRLRWHRDRKSVHPSPPSTETKNINVQVGGVLKEIDTQGWGQFLGMDRYQAEQVIGVALLNDHAITTVRRHVVQLHPHLVLFAVSEETVGNDSWWKDKWRK